MGKDVAQRKVSPALVAEQGSARAMLAAGKEVMAVLDSGKLGNTVGFSAFMTGFALHAQSELWLTGFQITEGGEEIEIRGRLLDPVTLPAYVQGLSSEPVFQGRRFAALEMRGVDPDELATNQPIQPVAVNGADQAAQPQPVFRLPRFVEFVLRSENAGGADTATRGGVKQ